MYRDAPLDKSRMLTTTKVMKTQGLFLETSYADQSSVYYCLSPFDNTEKGLPSIYRLYLEMGDLEEYTFAETYFLGMDHWRKICEAPFFKPYLERMRGDLEKKIKSEAVRKIIAETTNPDSKNYFQSLKWLAEKGYKEKAQKGRPSKAEVERAAREEADSRLELSDIVERLDIKPREIN